MTRKLRPPAPTERIDPQTMRRALQRQGLGGENAYRAVERAQIESTPTIAQLIPAGARGLIYAILTALAPGYYVAESIYTFPAWSNIIVAIVVGAGFDMARRMT